MAPLTDDDRVLIWILRRDKRFNVMMMVIVKMRMIMIMKMRFAYGD